MEADKGKISEIKFLSSIIQDNLTLRGRIATLTFQNMSYSSLTDQTIIFIEHFQSIILFITSNYKFFGRGSSNVSVKLINMVYPIASSLNLASYMPLNKDGTTTVLAIALVGFLIFLFKMAIFGYIVTMAVKLKTPSKPLQVVWQWIFKLQTRVGYYLIATIWAQLIEGVTNNLLDLGEGTNTSLRILGILMLVLEFGFCILLETQLTYILPNKGFSSSKNNVTQIVTLLQKFLNQLIRKGFGFSPEPALWAANIIVLLLSIWRAFCYFYYLPYYKIGCLFYEVYFLVVVLALNTACALQVFFGDNTIDMNLVIGIWVILSALFLKIAVGYMKNRLWKMVLSTEKSSPPEALVQRVIAAKYFFKVGKQTQSDQSWRDLVKASLRENIGKSFLITENYNQSLNDKETRNKIFSKYLEQLLVKYPKSDFIRLYAAHYFAKKQGLYGKALRTIHELKVSNSWSVKNSITVLFKEIKCKIITDSKNKRTLYDISEFAQCTSSFAQAKLKVLEQMELQASLYQEMKEESPLLTKLIKLGKQIVKLKKEIERDQKKFFQMIPEYFVEPLLLYAQYNLVLNHSYEKFTEYHKIYSKRYQKYVKTFSNDNFCQENFFKKNTGYLIISGERSSQGRILHCGGNYEEFFGRNISGQYMGVTVPTITMTDPRVLFNMIFENGENAVINRMQKRHFYHQDGSMTEVEIFFNISPFLSQGLTYYVIFRTAKDSKECLLVNQEGVIESFTRRVGVELNLRKIPSEERSLGKLCPELQLANEAFNIVSNEGKAIKNGSKANSPDSTKAKGKSFFAKKGPMMSLEEAKDMCSTFQGGEQIVNFEGSKFPYKCHKVVPFTNNIYGAKEIFLERISEKDAKETFEEVSRVIDEKTLSKGNETFKGKPEWEDECPEVYENEKETGWFNFQTLDVNFRATTNQETMPLTIQSPVSSTRHLVSSRSMKPPQRNTFTIGSNNNFLPGATTEGEKVQEIESLSNVLSRQESVFSLRSEYTARNKMKKQKIFEQANLAAYTPPKYKFLTAVLFAVMGSIFMLQQILNAQIRSGFDDMNSNKDIVLITESRNYYMMYLNVIICIIYGEGANFANVSSLLPGRTVANFELNLDIAIANLSATNSELFGLANDLNDAQRGILFRKDVRVFDTVYGGDYTKFTSFHATNQMIETALRVKSLMVTQLSKTVSDMEFIENNMMNDLLVKGNNIADEFLANLQERKQTFLNSLLYTFLGITIIPIGGFFVAYIFIYAQYRVDLANMLAFTKINKHAVENILANLLHFKKFLQLNVNFEGSVKDERYVKLFKNNMESFRNEKNQAIDNIQSPNAKGFTKHYVRLLIIVFMMLVNVSISFFIYYVIFTKNLKSLGDQAYQLYLIDRTSSRILALRNGILEMLITNDGIPIYNEVPSVYMAQQITALQDTQNHIQGVFGSATNASIHNIMFEDACAYLEDQVMIYNYCRKIGNYQDKVSYINLLGSIIAAFQGYLDKYAASDKSQASRLALEKAFVGITMQPIAGVTTAINTIITDILNEEFQNLNDASKAWNNKMPYLYLVIVLITFRMGLWDVILPLNRKEAKFRRLLLLFPANVVLSNFMLKSYLLKVSRGAFDSVRNDI